MKSGESTPHGFTLIEVMVAAAVLGIAATALFSLFSRSLLNLRGIADLRHYQLAAQEIMDRAMLLSTLPREASIDGRQDRLNARWAVHVMPWIPKNLDGKPPEAIMRIEVELRWLGRAGERTITLETVRPAKIEYSNFDLYRAMENVIPN